MLAEVFDAKADLVNVGVPLEKHPSDRVAQGVVEQRGLEDWGNTVYQFLAIPIEAGVVEERIVRSIDIPPQRRYLPERHPDVVLVLKGYELSTDKVSDLRVRDEEFLEQGHKVEVRSPLHQRPVELGEGQQ